MPLTVTFLGHSGFLFSDGRKTLAVDPFLTGNPLAKHKPADIRCDYIALTHGHDDHVGDTVAIAKANKAPVIAVNELAIHLGEKGVEKTEPGNPGGRIMTDFGYVAFTPAFHSSSYEGRYMGQPAGLVIEIAGVKIYHAGDTGLFSDMKLIGEYAHPLIACLPVGDRFTMGPALAARAAEFVKPRYAIPVHYKTFPLLTDDISEFKPEGVEVKVMEPGEQWRVPE
ncbi:MAG: metal-dependent hydrolase [Phycisphaeraceae bacterium]|nr:metal-dependent hydrolase [Phycisphaeraceae bacterium]